MRIFKYLFSFLFIFCFIKVIFAFQATSLTLNILDQNGALIPNVIAHLKKQNTVIKEVKASKPQILTFSNLKPDKYLLEIKAVGFQSFSEEIEIKTGANQQTISLKIAEIAESVIADRSQQEKNLDAKDGVFTNFLTKAEIDALPDDPKKLKEALQQKFGADAEFLVDGFGSKGLPPKSQIASIKVNQSSFDAEYHTLGVTYIEILTKAGFEKWFGEISFNFNDESLNARNPMARLRYPQQNKAVDIFLAGPIKKGKTSAIFEIYDENSFETNHIVAVLPTENVNNFIRSSFNNLYVFSKIVQNLSQYQTLNLSYTFSKNDFKNAGIGGFSLPERAFNSSSNSHLFRLSESGNIGKRAFNEFRFQYQNESSNTISANKDAAIIVIDAFSKGGAGNDNINKKQSIYLADNYLFGIKNHALKIGGIFDYERQYSISAENQNGTFTFSSLKDFLLNKPQIFTQRLENAKVKLAQLELSGFVQDDIRLHKSLMLSAGLRYEWQNNLQDKNNFSPRIGFAWSPREDGKTTFRGGVGLFNNWFETNALAKILSQDQNQPNQTIIINPGFPNPFSSGTSQILKKSYWQQSSDLKNPEIFLTQFGVQQQLSEKSFLRIQYSYQKGLHQFRSRDLNAPINFNRPNTNLGQLIQFESSAFFVKNILKIDYTVTPTKTTFLSVNYKLAKSILDANGNFGLPSDNYNLQLDRSVSNKDQRHNIYSTFGWALPKGLRFSTIFRAGSSLPYTITTGRDDNGDTIFNDRPPNILRNSERGNWQKQFDTTLRWQFSLEKNKEKTVGIADPSIESSKGKTFVLEIKAINILNQTNFTNYVGVQTSPFFRQPISADNPRRIEFGLRFSF